MVPSIFIVTAPAVAFYGASGTWKKGIGGLVVELSNSFGSIGFIGISFLAVTDNAVRSTILIHFKGS